MDIARNADRFEDDVYRFMRFQIRSRCAVNAEV